jgi:hypothetical protein
MKQFFKKYNDLLFAIFAWSLSLADLVYAVITDSVIGYIGFGLMGIMGYSSYSDYRKSKAN